MVKKKSKLRTFLKTTLKDSVARSGLLRSLVRYWRKLSAFITQLPLYARIKNRLWQFRLQWFSRWLFEQDVNLWLDFIPEPRPTAWQRLLRKQGLDLVLLPENMALAAYILVTPAHRQKFSNSFYLKLYLVKERDHKQPFSFRHRFYIRSMLQTSDKKKHGGLNDNSYVNRAKKFVAKQQFGKNQVSLNYPEIIFGNNHSAKRYQVVAKQSIDELPWHDYLFTHVDEKHLTSLFEQALLYVKMNNSNLKLFVSGDVGANRIAVLEETINISKTDPDNKQAQKNAAKSAPAIQFKPRKLLAQNIRLRLTQVQSN